MVRLGAQLDDALADKLSHLVMNKFYWIIFRVKITFTKPPLMKLNFFF